MPKNHASKGKLRIVYPIVLCLILLCSGCSVVSLAYNNADWLILWKLNNYFDVNPQQEEFLEHHVVELHHWHRTSELPLYAGFLEQVQHTVRSGLSPEKLDVLQRDYQELRSHLAQKMAFHGTPFLRGLTPEQQQFFQEVLHEENHDLREKLGNTAEERLRHRMETVMDLMEFWLGDIPPEQLPIIQQLIRNFPDTTEAYLAYREYRQQQFLQILQHRRDSRQIERALSEWLNFSGRDVTQENFAGIQEWQQGVKSFLLEVDKLATPSQRQYMVNKLQSIIHILHTLNHA